MKGKSIRIVLLCGFILCGILTAVGQSDTGKKPAVVPNGRTNLSDSVKNALLTTQTREMRALLIEQSDDSTRMEKLRQELITLGDNDHKRKSELTTERDELAYRDSLRRVAQRQRVDSLHALIDGYPVVLGNDTLFRIYANLGSLSPMERSMLVSPRIHSLTKDYYFEPDSLRVIQSEFTTDIVYRSTLITSISDLDGIWMNAPRNKLANQYRELIADAVVRYKSERSLPARLREIATALLVLIILILFIYGINRLFRRIQSGIEKQKGKRIKGIRISGYQFLDIQREATVLITLVKFVKWFLILLAIYFTFPIMFGIFPYTVGLGPKLVSYFTNPVMGILHSMVAYLPKLITIIILVIFFRYLLKILYYFKSEIQRGALKIPGFYVDWANPTYQIIRILVLAFSLIAISPYLPGSNSQIFKGVSVFIGVLVTFGSAGALGNVVSGLVLTYMRAYKIGDRVRMTNIEGDVVEKSLLVTRIRTIKNEIVSIPNSNVMGGNIINYSAVARESGLIIHTQVTIGYDTPWRKVHELLIRAALNTENIEKEPIPFVFQISLGDFYICYQINAYTREANRQHLTYSFLHQNIQDAFNEAGVEIMSAHYNYVRDGNKSTVPDDFLPEDYVSPSFRVKSVDRDPPDNKVRPGRDSS